MKIIKGEERLFHLSGTNMFHFVAVDQPKKFVVSSATTSVLTYIYNRY